MSTEADLRNKMVEAIRDISEALGFDDEGGNIHHYPLEFEHEEKHSRYLTANVDGKRVGRAWSVYVTSYDNPFALRNVWERQYTVRINAYYELDSGVVNTVIDHGRQVRQALRGLGLNLEGVVTRILEFDEFTVERDEDLIVGEQIFTAQHTNVAE